ncbi:glycosyltransferase family 2 protein [Anaerolineales bacterium HSG25]|nr:glycosyltransferase family 2 protein [Anaerolineales bacterium HSG25]
MTNSITKPRPDISVIIVNWNTRDMLADCIDSIEQHADSLQLEIIVVDNYSSDGSQAMLQEKYPHVWLIANLDNVGFAKANNLAMKVARGRYFLLWNSDAFAVPDSMQSLYRLAESQPNAGLIGAQLRNKDGTFQASHTLFPNLWQEFLILTALGRKLHGNVYPSRGPEDERGPQRVDYVEGACMLVRREAFQQVGGMDEGYFMYAEEVDWCFSLQTGGWQVWYQPESKVTHLGGASSSGRRTKREGDLYRSRVRFFRKHYGNRQAQLLKGLIYGTTLAKTVVHGGLRMITKGRIGRQVVTLSHLRKQLQDV